MKVYIHFNHKRAPKVIVEDHDLWSLDQTLAKVIFPSLVAFKERSPNGSDKKKYSYLDDMIEGFRIASEDTWPYKSQTEIDQVKKALKLFSKYFTQLWF